MIRIELFVEDKKVAAVLHALDGLVIQLNAQPVRNAAVKNGKVGPAGQPTSGKDVILEAMKKGKGETNTKEVRALGKTYGVGNAQIYAAFNKMLKEKLVKRKGKGHYILLTQTEAK